MAFHPFIKESHNSSIFDRDAMRGGASERLLRFDDRDLMLVCPSIKNFQRLLEIFDCGHGRLLWSFGLGGYPSSVPMETRFRPSKIGADARVVRMLEGS